MKRIIFLGAFLLGLLMLPCRNAFAQHKPDTLTVGMYAPSAASLMTYTDYPVSYITGQPDISIPLYTIHSGALELPVTIHFHMADFLRVNQPAGAIGAGWSISTDLLVTRKIKGLDDFMGNGYYLTGDDLPETDVTGKGSDQRIHNIVHEYSDSEPDVFYYNTLSGNGKFYITPGPTAIQVPTGPEKIEAHPNLPPYTSDRFVVTDGSGFIHHYSDDYSAADKSGLSYTAWHCTEISDDNMANTISFEYCNSSRSHGGCSEGITVFDDFTRTTGNATQQITDEMRGPVLHTGRHDYQHLLEGEFGGPYHWGNATLRPMLPGPQSHSNEEHLVSRIAFRGGYVQYSYHTAYEQEYYVNPYKYLTKIEVYADDSPMPVKTIAFEHEDSGNGYDVFLTGLVIDGTQRYGFSYGAQSSRKGTPDYWGYDRYENNGLPHVSEDSIDIAAYDAHILSPSDLYGETIVPQFIGTIDKMGRNLYVSNPDSVMMLSVHYPTGGSTVFGFEYDRFQGGDSQEHVISSRRVSSVKYYDTNGLLLKHIAYSYLNGKAFHEPVSENGAGFVNTVASQTLNYLYTDDPSLIGYLFDVSLGTIRKRFYPAHSLFDDEFSSSWVRYPEVHEIVMNGNTPAFKTVFTYDLDGHFAGSPGVVTRINPMQPYPLEKDYWYCGIPLTKKVYTYSTASGYSLFETTEYKHACHMENFKINEGRAWPYMLCVDASGTYGTDAIMKNMSDYYLQVQQIDVGCMQKTEEKVTRILDDGTQMVTKKEYKYDNPNGYTVNRIITTYPDGKTDTELFAHTDDYHCQQNLGQRPSLLTEYVRIEDGIIAEGWCYDRTGVRINRVYHFEANYLPASAFRLSSTYTTGVFDWSGTNAYLMSPDSHYQLFDSYGYDSNNNLNRIQRRGEPEKTFLWGYGGLHPVACAVGADIRSHGGDLPAGPPANLRQLYPGAHITTATWKPLVGITTLTTPDGISQTFEYNNYNRLHRVLSDGNLMQTYDYSFDDTASSDEGWIKTRSYRTSYSYAEDIDWYNGIGLHDRKVEVEAANGGKDRITPTSYDYYLRADATVKLPYAAPDNRHRTSRAAMDAEQYAYYSNSFGPLEATQAYHKKTYDHLPIDRVRSYCLPGMMGLMGGQLNDKTTKYSYVSNGSDDVMRMYSQNGSGWLSAMSYYPAGKLICVHETGPDGSVLKTYYDGRGRKVLERRNAESRDADTYFAYDSMGRLRWVVTPEGVSDVISDENVLPTSQTAKKYCYYYEYDAKGNVTKKQLPGAEAMTYSYDIGNRVTSFTNGLITGADGPKTYAYDSFGRETATSMAENSPSGPAILTETIYDSYPATLDARLDFDGSHLAGLTSYYSAPVGKKTWGRERILGSAGYLQRAFYYDRLGNIVQEVELRPEDGLLYRKSCKYDLGGNVVESVSSTYKLLSDGVSVQIMDSISTNHSYDNRCRPTSVSTTGFGTGFYDPITYAYDDHDRVTSVTFGYGLREKYAYNIQGWRTSQTVLGMSPQSDTLFHTNLYYYDANPYTSSPYGRTGRIMKQQWKHAGCNLRSETYLYDNMHRLVGSSYFDNAISSAIYLTHFAYDRNGNLTNAMLTDRTVGPDESYVYHNYSYLGNHRQGYSYDAAGNIIQEPGIVSATYNILCLPEEIVSSDHGTTKYYYTATGKKTAAVKNDTGFVYVGEYRYKKINGSLSFESAEIEHGRFQQENTGSPKKLFYIKDQIGNTRVVVSHTGVIKEQNDFLPYGEKINDANFISGNNDYLYGGKELQRLFDIPWYDNGARFLTTTGIFTSIDPLAEQSYHITPYSYAACDPVNNIDKDGRTPDLLWDVANLAMDAASLHDNIRNGNVGAALLDGAGLVFDAFAAVIPIVPGGAGALINGLRAADKVTDGARMMDKAADGAKLLDKAGDVSKTTEKAVHGNSKLSTKAQHSYDIIDNETGNRVKVGISGGRIRRDGKSYRAERQVRKLNQGLKTKRYRSEITRNEPAGEGARVKIENYEKKRSKMLRELGEIDPNIHKRP